MLIAEEANAIESAYMRIDLVAPQVQRNFVSDFDNMSTRASNSTAGCPT
jgi:hypothetical protein